MNKLEFYDAVLENLRKRVEKGEMIENYNILGNLAYFCDICTEKYYEMTSNSLKIFSTNEFCWFIYISIRNDLMDKAKTETEKEFLRADFKITKILWRLKLLKGFECALEEEFPEWFFEKYDNKVG